MKYAPPREDGLKPWVVTVKSWGQSHDRLIYASKRSEAEYEAKGRQRYMSAKARRATPDDVAEMSRKGANDG